METAAKRDLTTQSSASEGSQVIERPSPSSTLAEVRPRLGGTQRSVITSTRQFRPFRQRVMRCTASTTHRPSAMLLCSASRHLCRLPRRQERADQDSPNQGCAQEAPNQASSVPPGKDLNARGFYRPGGNIQDALARTMALHKGSS